MIGTGCLKETKDRTPGSPDPDSPLPQGWFQSDTSGGRTALHNFSRLPFTVTFEAAQKETADFGLYFPEAFGYPQGLGLHFPGIFASLGALGLGGGVYSPL